MNEEANRKFVESVVAERKKMTAEELEAFEEKMLHMFGVKFDRDAFLRGDDLGL